MTDPPFDEMWAFFWIIYGLVMTFFSAIWLIDWLTAQLEKLIVFYYVTRPKKQRIRRFKEEHADLYRDLKQWFLYNKHWVPQEEK